MRGSWALVPVVVLAGCVGSGATTTTSTTSTSTTTTEVTTTTRVVTTVAPTTTTLAPVTDHPNLPAAESRSVVPWWQVDGSWVLALYSGATDAEPGPTVLYLASPEGQLFEMGAWDAGEPGPLTIEDWSPERRRVLLQYGGFSDLHKEIRVLPLDIGDESTPIVAPELSEIAAGFVPPFGTQLVQYRNDNSDETLEIVGEDGSPVATLASQPPDALAPLTWLFDPEGTTVVVGDRYGLHVLSNLGDFVRELDSPGEACRPVRWWDEATVLASCIPREMAWAGESYHQLWLVPLDGGVALNLTIVPGSPGASDFGYTDARQAGGEVYLQWRGDCPAAHLELLFGGGSFAVEASGQQVVIGVVESGLMLHMWDGCTIDRGTVRLVSPDGEVLSELFPRFQGVEGVVSAVMLP